jgi:hypothetical protein
MASNKVIYILINVFFCFMEQLITSQVLNKFQINNIKLMLYLIIIMGL